MQNAMGKPGATDRSNPDGPRNEASKGMPGTNPDGPKNKASEQQKQKPCTMHWANQKATDR